MIYTRLSLFLLACLTLAFGIVQGKPCRLPEESNLPPSQTDEVFISTSLNRTNAWRALHEAKDLAWNSTLANFARAAANTCNGQHTVRPLSSHRDHKPKNQNAVHQITHSNFFKSGYGENIYSFSTTADTVDFLAKTSSGIDAWMGEAPLYNPSNPANYSSLHFTQVVWKASTTLGCAWTEDRCASGWWHLYCEYYPRGNVIGTFLQNVTP